MDDACHTCGTVGGTPRYTGGPPRRIDGGRFGVEGRLCFACYRRLERAEPRRAEPRRADRNLVGDVRPPAPEDAPPCDLCGATDGRVQPGRGRRSPIRYQGRPHGIEGLICWECRQDLIDEEIDRQAQAWDIAARAAAVREAKIAKGRRNPFGWDGLTPAELDAVLPAELVEA